MNGKYIYGIIANPNEAVFDVAGVADATPVRTVASDGLGCVVSDYDAAPFDALTKEQLVRNLLAHQRVVEYVMHDGAVLPVKFGTLLADAEAARAMLVQARAELSDALAAIGDRVEVEVAATWDINRVLREVAAEETVVRAREAIASASEQQTKEQRIALGRLVKACLDRHRDDYRERMIGFLRPLAVDVAPNVLVADAMVMNVAFLVERARQQEFDEGVHQLDALFRGEIDFRVIGPLPPYSFSTVEIARIAPAQLDEARRLLGLGEDISEAVVRKAYRQLAAAAQRRLESGGQSPDDGFARMRAASDLLLRYCRASRTAADQSSGDGGCFAIAIRRSGGDEVAAARFGGTDGV